MSMTLLLGFASFALFGASLLALSAWQKARLRALVLETGNIAGAPPTVWRAVAGRFAKIVEPKPEEREELAAALLHAGRHARAEMDRFLEERVLSLALGMVGALAFPLLLGGKLGLMLMLISLYLGMSLPRKLLERSAQERREEIGRALPSAIDLLMTSVDAGLSINQSIARVAREMTRSSPVLSEELGITASECDAGVSLAESLHRLSRRVELDEMTGLCGVISQAHELGAPIVETLDEYAEQSRKLRLAVLEERAGKLVIRLTLPLAMFLLPAALIAILGPAAIQLMNAVKN